MRFLRHRHLQRGFTIIEVLIVLAIAGLLLIMILLAVPAMQRNHRNTERREIVALVYGEVQHYMQNTNSYPDTPAEFCAFFNASSLKSKSPGAPPCQPVLDSAGDCVLVQGDLYVLCYHDRMSNHDYVGPYDQINIQHAHWCSDGPGNPHGYPITDEGSGDTILTKYVVWSPLENGGFACTGSD